MGTNRLYWLVSALFCLRRNRRKYVVWGRLRPHDTEDYLLYRPLLYLPRSAVRLDWARLLVSLSKTYTGSRSSGGTRFYTNDNDVRLKSHGQGDYASVIPFTSSSAEAK